jgi:hypothetical protein
MTTIQLLPKEADVIKAFPEEGAVLLAHLALATQQVPGEVETEMEQLRSKGLVERTKQGLVQLTDLGIRTRRAVATGWVHRVTKGNGVSEGSLDLPAAVTTPWPSSPAPRLGSAAVVVGAVTGAAIAGPVGSILGGPMGAATGIAIGGTLGTLIGRQFQGEPDSPRVEILSESVPPT